jgi:hypothetical protein
LPLRLLAYRLRLRLPVDRLKAHRLGGVATARLFGTGGSKRALACGTFFRR